MIPSTDAYNEILVNEIRLDSDSQIYQRSPEINSINYPGYSYHYEFWLKGDGNLYACIHCTHQNPNINLVNRIKGLFRPIKIRLESQEYKSVVNIPLNGLSGSASPINTYPINIKCRLHGAGYTTHNANLMRQIIEVTHGKI